MPLFYGWRIVGVSVATQALQAGLLIYSFGSIALALEVEFGSTRQQVMLGATFLSIVTNIISPFGGVQVDRGSVRRLMMVGLAALSAGLLILSQAQALWHAWLAFGLILPLANLLLGQLTSSALVARWFQAKRGTAMGISAVGTSIGGFIFPLAFASLSAVYDWRTALLIIGIGSFVLVFPLIWFVIVDRPELRGDEPDGAALSAGASQVEAKAAESALTIRTILGQSAFWIETVVIGLLLFIYIGMLNNLVPHAVGLGIEATQAAALLSVLAVFSIIGKLSFGTIADRIDLRQTLWLAMLFMMLGSGILILAKGYWGIAAAVLMFGLAAGGLLPVWGAMVAKSFGKNGFGRALGVMNLAMMPITSLAAPFAGTIYDWTGGYTIAFAIFIGLLVLAAGLLTFLTFPDEKTVG